MLNQKLKVNYNRIFRWLARELVAVPEFFGFGVKRKNQPSSLEIWKRGDFKAGQCQHTTLIVNLSHGRSVQKCHNRDAPRCIGHSPRWIQSEAERGAQPAPPDCAADQRQADELPGHLLISIHLSQKSHRRKGSSSSALIARSEMTQRCGQRTHGPGR